MRDPTPAPDWRGVLRAGTDDADLFRSVYVANEYRLPERFDPSDIVIDIGAHIGFFAVAALMRGAGLAVCFEPAADNFALLTRNLAPAGQRVECHQLAVWRSGDHPPVGLVRETTTSGHHLSPDAPPVPTVGLDAVLCRFDRVRLLKLDCEGSEYEILQTSQQLDRVAEVVGEYHVAVAPGQDADLDSRLPALATFLREQGFAVELVPHPEWPHRIGWFFGRRGR